MKNEKFIKTFKGWLYIEFCKDLENYVKGFKGITITKGEVTIDLWADEFWELLVEFYEKKKEGRS